MAFIGFSGFLSPLIRLKIGGIPQKDEIGVFCSSAFFFLQAHFDGLKPWGLGKIRISFFKREIAGELWPVFRSY